MPEVNREQDGQRPAAARPSMRNAINAKCKDCLYDPVDGGNWRQQAEACTSPECPLFELRPRARGRDSRESSTRCERGREGAPPDNGEVLEGAP